MIIVVRGASYKEDLYTLRSYIEEVKPVLIAVDGGERMPCSKTVTGPI